MTKQQKRDIIAQRTELAALVNAWDPVGLFGAGSPQDEYHCRTDGLLSRLHRCEDLKVISQLLRAELAEHFGASVEETQVDGFANEAKQWFDRSGT